MFELDVGGPQQHVETDFHAVASHALRDPAAERQQRSEFIPSRMVTAMASRTSNARSASGAIARTRSATCKACSE